MVIRQEPEAEMEKKAKPGDIASCPICNARFPLDCLTRIPRHSRRKNLVANGIFPPRRTDDLEECPGSNALIK
jgi:hypothetical protein